MIQLDLFDKMVKPILLYGCEVWDFSNNAIIVKVHLKFCKLLLHLKSWKAWRVSLLLEQICEKIEQICEKKSKCNWLGYV
jgi:hypothetical protein